MITLDQVKKGKKYLDKDGFVKNVLYVSKNIIVYEYKGLSCTPDAMYETAVATNAFLINHVLYKKKRAKK